MFQSGGIIQGVSSITMNDDPIDYGLLAAAKRCGYALSTFSAEMVMNKKQCNNMFCAIGEVPKCYHARHTQTLKQFIKNKRKGIK